MPSDNPINGIVIQVDKQKFYSRKDLAKFIREVVAPEKVFGNRTKEVQEKLVDFFCNRNVPENPDYKFWLQRYCDVSKGPIKKDVQKR